MVYGKLDPMKMMKMMRSNDYENLELTINLEVPTDVEIILNDWIKNLVNKVIPEMLGCNQHWHSNNSSK